MIQFGWPWIFVLLPLPILVRWFLAPADPSRGAALRVPFLREFPRTSEAGNLGSRDWLIWLAGLAWIFLLAAGSRPQWSGAPVELPISGRDLMIAVDLSRSMEERDFQIQGRTVDRLTATKSVATDFISRREGDRIGLILFGEKAYLQTPLTFDRQTVLTLLDEAQIGLAGRATAIGDAIGLAVKRLRGNDASHRVLILMTDGANTAGEVLPLQAADIANSEALTIYTIGIGADAAEMFRRGFMGTQRSDSSTDLDEQTLLAIAERTGGQYFRAHNTDELERIYALLDELEPIEQDPDIFRPIVELFHWPLTGAFVLCALLLAIKVRDRAI